MKAIQNKFKKITIVVLIIALLASIVITCLIVSRHLAFGLVSAINWNSYDQNISLEKDMSENESSNSEDWCQRVQFDNSLNNSNFENYQIADSNTARTADDGINWVASKVGQSIDWDGAYGAQCVDLIMAYYSYLGVAPARGNARDYVSNYLPDGWVRTPGGVPQKGDILVYTGGAYGHVAIYDSDYSVYQQNYGNHQWVEHTTFRFDDYNYFRPCVYWGCIHPNFSGGYRPRVDIEEGMYNIFSAVGNKVVDVNGGVAQCGNNVQIYSPNFTQAQSFNIYYNPAAGDHAQGGYHIEMGHSNLFLDTAGNEPANGANVALWGDTGANGQYWIFEDAGSGWVFIRNLLGYYLDVDNGIDANGVNVQTWQFSDVPAQKYRLQKCSGSNRIELQEGNYTVKSAVGNKFLDVNGGVASPGTNVQIFSPNSSDAQKFHIYFNPQAGDNSQGGWHVENSYTSMFVDTAGDNGGPGTNVALWGDTGANGQYWVFENAGYGYFYIRNLWGWYLDVDCGIDEDGRNVQICSFNGSNAQKWLLNCLDYSSDSRYGENTSEPELNLIENYDPAQSVNDLNSVNANQGLFDILDNEAQVSTVKTGDYPWLQFYVILIQVWFSLVLLLILR